MYFLSVIFLLGCGPSDDETGLFLPTSEVTQTNTGTGGCEEVTLNYDGEDEPVVGDMWTVWLKCDGALLMGPSVLSVEPVEFAQIFDKTVTFAMAGSGDIRLQTGTWSDTITITVTE